MAESINDPPWDAIPQTSPRALGRLMPRITGRDAEPVLRVRTFNMSSATTLLEFPWSDSTISVKLINSVNFGPAILKRFMAPPAPGLEQFRTSPSLSFLLEHPSGRKLVWDLGIRKDFENYSPSIAEYLPTTHYKIEVQDNVADILVKGGVDLAGIEAVVWSHWHWDHIGDPSTFPSSTDLIVGPGFKAAMLPGAPASPRSPIKEADYTGRNLREITFDDASTVKIGRFKAYDYFGDGSFYLLDSPGHAVGHLCGLARTTVEPLSFIVLGGDVCHYAGIFRPSKLLPIPSEIKPHPFRRQMDSAFCPGHSWEQLQKHRGRSATDSLFDMTFGIDIPLANKTKEKLQDLDSDERVFIIIAHDAQVRDGVPHFPESLNDWKEKGFGTSLKWAFLRDLESYWAGKGLV
ncbi:hypothetical protein K461DRAFT_313448 [Myriangium duriaei CBS 260.36]|uniref:Metallo-beta-lactamase domain-containing protein n=1 Tax=Myriangium duriaei CBS 260.36 TaxID=1168546 RepID=A0A9P4MFY2_9PEZI|nr:hypothetical protein K461DRAFT_313448 [Myriangium duriaei CBS 260.36]